MSGAVTAPARIQTADISEVGPDDFCRECRGGGCEYCDGRGHRVASRLDVRWPRSAAPAWHRLGRGVE